MKKAIGFLICLVALVGAVGATGQQEGAGTGESVEGIQSSADLPYTVEFTYLRPMFGEASLRRGGPYEQMVFEQGNVEIDTQIIPFTEYDTKLPVQLAGGSIPDVFWTNGPADSIHHDLVEQGALLPLDDLLEEYPVVKNAQPDFLWDKAKSPDGNTYWLPSPNLVYVPFPFLYRQDIWEAEGLDVPTTLDEFVSQLQELQDKYPDMVPLTVDYYDRWAFQNLGPAFGYGFFNWIPDRNNPDRIIPSDVSPNHRDFLEFIQMLRQEELLDPDMLLERSGAGGQKFQAGDALVLGGGAGFFDLPGLLLNLREAEPNAELAYMPPLEGPGGVMACTVLGGYNKGVVISSEAADKAEDIFRFLTWTLSDGYELMVWGVEGKSFEWSENEEYRILMNDNDRPDPDFTTPMLQPYQFFAKFEDWGRINWDERRAAYLTAPAFEDDVEALEYFAKFARMYEEQTENAVPNWNRNTFSPTQADRGGSILNQHIVPAAEKYFIDPDASLAEFDAAVEQWLTAGGQDIIDEVNENQADISRPEPPQPNLP